MSTKPWKSGPRELLDHAIEHIKDGTPFDYRIALISIDNAVELGIKTFLGLPKRVRGSDGPSRRQLQDAGTSFPDLLDLLEEYGESQIAGIDLGDIEVYHRLRNTLYHEGNGVTVDPEHVDGYLQIARILLQSLLELEVDEPELPNPRTAIGDFILEWGHLEEKLRNYGQHYLVKERTKTGPITGLVDGLIAKGILKGEYRSKLEQPYHARNAIVHGFARPPDVEVKEYIRTVKELNAALPG